MGIRPKCIVTSFLILFFLCSSLYLISCSVVSTTYKIGKGTVKTTYKITEAVTKGAFGTAKVIYKVGGFTFNVVTAPLDWPFTRDGLESIDGLSPKEAVKRGRVKKSPYVVNGKRYVPMSVKASKKYREKGVASWYGYETRNQKGGHMTANGEAFDPNGLNAAHKHLPLPTYVKVTNLSNNRSIILRVNDRGPFVAGRIIDLSAGAAKRLGYYKNGTARVLVEAIEVKG
ncbi:septal ring lytic transglycosylase RlpA family protein [Thermodesulfobacteriota bacterium]